MTREDALRRISDKQTIYAYFGSKDALFDSVLNARLRLLTELVPFTPDDLPSYIGALFDQLTADTGLLRLTQWKALAARGMTTERGTPS